MLYSGGIGIGESLFGIVNTQYSRKRRSVADKSDDSISEANWTHEEKETDAPEQRFAYFAISRGYRNARISSTYTREQTTLSVLSSSSTSSSLSSLYRPRRNVRTFLLLSES